MGQNTLNSVTAGAVETSDINQYFTALAGDFVPRQVSGSSAIPIDDTYRLGVPLFKWKEAHITSLFLDGALFDPSATGVATDWAINSGAVRSTSDQPDFLRATGAGAIATILATATDLVITADNVSVSVSADISITGLTLAPSSNNTATVNDGGLSDQESSKFTGESVDFKFNNDPTNTDLTISGAGTEITNRIGEFICLKTPDGEFMYVFVESATTLNRAFRGFFFDSSGNPVERGTLANSDTLTIMSLGWVFLDVDGATVDVSYTTPIFAFTEPVSPVTDDYWFDLLNRQWKRYDGAAFQEVDRVPIGLVVIDGTNCVASRSFDITQNYSELNEFQIVSFSNTVVKSASTKNSSSIYGNIQEFLGAPVEWDTATDFESGVIEDSNTTYYLYITQDGDTVISDQKYYNRWADLQGFYHPYNSWRCVGTVLNDGSSNFSTITQPEAVTIPEVVFPTPTAAASQAEQEAGSSTTVYTSPGRQQYHQSAAKFWARIAGPGVPVINISYNLTSITDVGIGLIGFTIATDFSSANWISLTEREDTATSFISIVLTSTPKTAGTCRVDIDADMDSSSKFLHIVGYGDQ